LTHRAEDVKPLLARLADGDIRGIGQALFNRLEDAAFELNPSLRSLRRAMMRMGFSGVLMSGSGSTLYGLCRSAADARRLAGRLAGRGRTWATNSFDSAAR
jgi:4-diphosphocytidyl-2-C-methyl-D-erythritol kinase